VTRRPVVLRSVFLMVVLAACSAPAVGSDPPTPNTNPPAPTSSPIAADPSRVANGPPVARLSAEGGDPLTGLLGTYTWGDGGSDSPWLSGAAIAVGAGEPLSAAFDPVVAVESWRARSVPSTADGPDGASVLGQGGGDPTFAAPVAGSWTVEVHVVFASGAGDASYFWRLDVT